MMHSARRDETNISDKGAAEDYKRLLLTVKAMGARLWDYDLGSGTLFCNDRWHEILGLDSNISPVTSLEAFCSHIHPDDIGHATHVDVHALEALIARDERYHVEFRIVRPDGTVRRVRTVACVLRERADHLRAVGCITDVTELAPSEPIILPVQLTPQAAPYGPSRPPLGTLDAEPDVNLIRRERECLLWVSVGKTAWETAAILGRSRRTVEFHRNHAIRKLNAANKVHAAAIAIRSGIL